MKKKISLLLLSISIFTLNLNAQNLNLNAQNSNLQIAQNFQNQQNAKNSVEIDLESVSQIIIPKEIFIGDEGQLQYSFRTPVDFFSLSSSSLLSGNELSLDFTNQDLLVDKNSCTIKNAVLVRNGLNYNLCISFIPWKIGKIEFREFDLMTLCLKDENSENKFMIQLNPVIIPSLSEKMGISNIRSPLNPITLPGTKYLLWLGIFLVILVLFLIAFAIIKLHVIVKKLRLLKNKIGFRRNARTVKKGLNKLLKSKSKIDDKNFAMNWQRLMRTYLEFRFASSFASITGNRIVQYILKITGNSCNDEEFAALENLAQIFIRTDYIRFAEGSIDSQLLPAEEHQAVFASDERSSIIKKTFEIIDVFESDSLTQEKNKK